jgi:membrane fusion protein, macrolide-specific efflux system
MSFFRFVRHVGIILNLPNMRKILYLLSINGNLYLGMVWMRKLVSTKKRIFFLLLSVVIIIFGGKHFFVDSKKPTQDFAIAKRGDIKEELNLSGEIYAEDHITLSFGVAGKIDRVGVKEGDWAKRGQIIAAVEKETYEAALRQAWQTFIAAKAASDEYYDGKDRSKAESYEQKVERTALDAAQNRAYDNVRIAQENLKSTILYSPIEGLVISANPSLAGVNITALNSGNYEIVNPSTVYLKVTADQTEVGSIKKGQTGTIIFDSYPEEEIRGIIKDISFAPALDETGTVYNVKVGLGNIDNKNYKYRLNMTADVNFLIKEKRNAIIIPTEFVQGDEKGKFVLLGKSKKKTYVKIGIESELNTEIISGISEGDAVYSL